MSWSEPGYEAVGRLVAGRTGLTFANRHESAELGIRRAMSRSHTDDLAHYLRLLTSRDDALDDLIGELTVGETYFFREPAQFQLLRQRVLPDLRQRRGSQHVVRAWSAGCASGEEAYSLAILFEQEQCPAHILASDISQPALARARQGKYGSWSLRGEGATEALPFLAPAAKAFQLDDRIRRLVSFEYLNLAFDAYPSFTNGIWSMDLILCRNVLIYFDADTVRQVAQRLFGSLAEGGWLLTSSSDPPLHELAPFAAIVTDAGVVYRRADQETKESGVRKTDWQSVLLQESGVKDQQASKSEEQTPQLEDAISSPEISVPMLAEDEGEEIAAAIRDVRGLANEEAAAAERACALATARFPLSTELHYLHALLLLELERLVEAAAAARRVLYLDRSLAAAHFTLGTILRRSGDLPGAQRAYRNARDLCTQRPAAEIVPLSDGETCGRLAEAAASQLRLVAAKGNT